MTLGAFGSSTSQESNVLKSNTRTAAHPQFNTILWHYHSTKNSQHQVSRIINWNQYVNKQPKNESTKLVRTKEPTILFVLLVGFSRKFPQICNGILFKVYLNIYYFQIQSFCFRGIILLKTSIRMQSYLPSRRDTPQCEMFSQSKIPKSVIKLHNL